jgi:aspartate aminotransferase
MLRSLAFARHNKKLITSQIRCKQGFFDWIPLVGLDPIKGLTLEFQRDTNPNKILLGEGVYRDNEGKPLVLKSVRLAEEKMFEANLDHEYAPVTGVPSFIEATKKFAFGENSEALKEQRIATIQSISGTGSLRVAAEFLKRFTPNYTKVFLPQPTWVNHLSIFNDAGFKTEYYRYFDRKTNGLDVEGLLEDLRKAPQRSIVLFHACAHNPTGCDPTPSVWKQISQVCMERDHLVLFDSAYQGFASGDPEKDAASFRMFVEDGHVPILVQSYSKNFGLYGERVGAVNIVCGSKKEAEHVFSQLTVLVRAIYSNPPLYGARIVSTIFNDAELRKQWAIDLKGMSSRIQDMRTALVKELRDAGSKKDWSHISNQIGMFAYSGLTPEQVELMKTKHHIYMTKDGRISISGLNTHNVASVAKAIHDVTK